MVDYKKQKERITKAYETNMRLIAEQFSDEASTVRRVYVGQLKELELKNKLWKKKQK